MRRHLIPGAAAALALITALTSGGGTALAEPLPSTGSKPLSCVPVRGDDDVTPAQEFTKLPQVHYPALPKAVHMRSNISTYNRQWEITLYKGSLYVRHRGSTEAWRTVPLPPCMHGQITGISMDAEELVALDKNGWVYTMYEAQKDSAEWRWVTAWGSLMRREDNFQLRNQNHHQWSLSIINIDDDKTYTDRNGQEHHISLAGCTQIVEMNPSGTQIFSHDPWLPNDDSYEWGTPYQSRFIARSLSASASVTLITNKYGDMYTRMWDYDYSGGDPAQFRYTFQNVAPKPKPDNWFAQRLLPGAPTIAVPVADWQRQPKIPGTITDWISIESIAPGSDNRLLKVEGMKNGVTGYWKKMLRGTTWTFVPTHEPLQGTILENSPRDRSKDTLRPPSGLTYRGTLKGLGTSAVLTVPNFAYASPTQPASLTIGNNRYPVKLHTVYGRLGTMVSQEVGPHPAGMTEHARRYAIALELPASVWRAQKNDPALRTFIQRYLRGDRIHEMYMLATSSQLRVINPLVQGAALSPFVDTLPRVSTER